MSPGGVRVAERTAIEWTDATFNPWWGCVRVSPACARCYADTLARRYGHAGLWQEHGVRRFLSDAHWRKPLTWNRDAARTGGRLKVFCASMADVFEEHRGLARSRDRLWSLIEETPWLHWQLLTKRPENVARLAPWKDDWPDNVWVGASIENSRFTFRADILREIPAVTRFVSAEPLLASVFQIGRPNRRPLDLEGIDWVIAGGESGPRARPMDPAWAREVREAIHDTGGAFFLKQLGGHPDKRGKDKAVLDGRLWHELPAIAATTPAREAA
jgi:protein gp37